jgi:hypothetical protein
MNEEVVRAAQPLDIQVQKLSEDSFRLVLKSSRIRNVDEGQAAMLPKATELCAEKAVRYGKHEYEQTEAVSPATSAKNEFILRQEIRCTDAPAVAGAPSDPAWRPTAEQQRLIERQTYDYFAAKDGGRYQDAYAWLAATQQEIVSFDKWSASSADFNSKAGQVRSRKIRKITWYKDPQGAPRGIYAAVDFASEFANIEIHCGFVAWRRQEDGSYKLIREEQNFIDRASQQKMKPGELEAVRRQFRC